VAQSLLKRGFGMVKEQEGTEARTARRRDFLKLAGTGVAGGAAATAAAVIGPAEAAIERAPAQGYRETEHVRKAYQLARF